MIQSVTITNYLSESVTLDLKNPTPSGFFIRGIDGLGPAKGTVNTAESLSLDGSVFNSSRLQERNILLNLGFLENPTIEHTRRATYKFLPVKKKVDLVIATDIRTYKTSGYVESNEPDIFSRDEGCVISIICPDPYFYAPDTVLVSFSHVSDGFSFPFENNSLTERLLVFSDLTTDLERTFTYEGDASIGITMRVHAMGPVSNLAIFNLSTRETMTIDDDILIALTGFALDAGDDIQITTRKGQKAVTLIRDGDVINILNALGPGSQWFTLERGENTFYYTADSGSSKLQFEIEYNIIYEGI